MTTNRGDTTAAMIDVDLSSLRVRTSREVDPGEFARLRFCIGTGPTATWLSPDAVVQTVQSNGTAFLCTLALVRLDEHDRARLAAHVATVAAQRAPAERRLRFGTLRDRARAVLELLGPRRRVPAPGRDDEAAEPPEPAPRPPEELKDLYRAAVKSL